MKKADKIFTLETVRKQYDSEISTDQHSIKALLEDPSISPPGEGESVSYAIHKIFHHLAVHTVAIIQVDKMIEEIQNEKE